MNKIIDIIQKLLAKASGTDSPAEAEAFLAKAHDLMETHQIEAHQLQQGHDPMGLTIGLFESSNSVNVHIQRALARYYGCRAIARGYFGYTQIELIGLDSARMTTCLLTPFVLEQFEAAVKKLKKEHKVTDTAARKDIAAALIERISQATSKAKAEAREGTSNSLVVISATNAFVAAHYQGLTKSKSLAGASSAGHKAAAGIAFTQQVTTRNPLALK
jgi:hypothetical protein